MDEIRLEQVSRLLINMTYTITEVAYICGFNSILYFNRVFRSKHGCTPREFRQNYPAMRVFAQELYQITYLDS
ncbi:helix-turn-helix domain-containing protein [Fibrella sp. WM1]|uniref:helix-turn-helix domain-containing protein n=1 Tax=Fibrella musci TaxID=3242485 RepID=UPI003521F6D2